jgi:hypothetical protein
VSRPWYQQLIGADPVLDEPTYGGFHHTVFMIGNTLIGLHRNPATEPADRLEAGSPTLLFELAPVRAACGQRPRRCSASS